MSWRNGQRPHWKLWRDIRLKALDRDSWECQKCGRKGRLEVDHIKPMEDGGAPLDLNNLMCLCRNCHLAKTRWENTERQQPSPDVVAWRKFVDMRKRDIL